MEPVGDLDDHVVEIVRAHVGRGLEIRCGLERECAGGRVDLEFCRIGAPDDREDERLRRIGLLAVTVVTAAVFSTIESAALSPPPFEVMTGGGSTWASV